MWKLKINVSGSETKIITEVKLLGVTSCHIHSILLFIDHIDGCTYHAI